MNNEFILWEVDYTKLKKRVLYVAANKENFKKLFEILNITSILYFYNSEDGLAEFCDVYETTRISLICGQHNIMRVGRVQELYIDSDCEIYSSLALYAPLCNWPGAKPFEVIDISEYKIFRVESPFNVNLLVYGENDPYTGVF